MNQNILIVLKHSDIMILTGLFFIILFLIFPNSKYSKSTVKRIIGACCLWWILLVYIYPPQGSNFNIYTYNAELTLYGQKAFERENEDKKDEDKLTFSNSKYLDYSGAQHLLYVFLESIDLYKINPKLAAFGFKSWIVLNITLILFLIYNLNSSPGEDKGLKDIWPIIFVSFCPIIPYYIIISRWEDKLIFLLLPLLILLLIKKKKYRVTSFLLGTILTFNGLTVFFLPVYLIFLFREIKEKIWVHIGLMLSGAILIMIPFFPESLLAWRNRIERTSIEKPFWFSFYSLLPDTYYSHILNEIFILILNFGMNLLYIYRKINIIDSIIFSVSIVVLCSPFNVASRIIPLILLFAFLSPSMNRYNWLSLGVILYLFLFSDSGYTTPIITKRSVILFNIPIIFSIALYLYKRIKFSNEFILKLIEDD